MAPDAGLLHLRAAGTSVLLDSRDGGLPVVVHWGGDLGDDVDGSAVAAAVRPAVAHSAAEVVVPHRLLPARADGWRGRPGLSGVRPGGEAWSPAFRTVSLEQDAAIVRVHAREDAAALAVAIELELSESGVLRLHSTVTNDGDTAYRLAELAAAVLPLPAVATELLDLTGRWCRERQPQRHPLVEGTWLREGRHGRTGHDAPLLVVAGVPGFGNRRGEVWGLHLGWSGDWRTWAERSPAGSRSLGAAELLGSGEVVLAPGETYSSPDAYAVHSSEGLDGLSAALHAAIRARPQHPRRPRPAVLNTWEAVYFDHRLERLTELADVAAAVGIERFVLDDGWFRHRRDDTAGLGDWYVDGAVWPQGLSPLIEHVRGLGMEFGLWVEPEMVNPDSDVYRAHPDWVLQVGDRLPVPWRHQQVLDLARPDAFAYLLERLDVLLSENAIAYLKWDHNRDLIEAGSGEHSGVHATTCATYRLLDELRARHPGVEIESCASGGGRVDLGILARTDRVWASDTNDALERTSIQRWTQLLLPPELVGSHVGPPRAHTTGRTHDLSFRVLTALFGHFGVEWDIAAASPAEREALARGIAFYKNHRDLLHGGTVVHADLPDPASVLHGVVAPDRSRALYLLAQVATPSSEQPGAVLLPGLEPQRDYEVRPVFPVGEPRVVQNAPPGWWPDGVHLPGRALAAAGLAMPVLSPEQAVLIQVTGG